MLSVAKSLFAGPLTAQPKHYHVIDVVRGLAACAILFWHYQHFFALGLAAPGSRAGYPLYGVFRLLYEQGGAAVQLFWIISGFVFSAVYLQSGVSAREFAQHRFARLYPLHLLTLLVVAAPQLVSSQQLGSALIYTQNTLPNFLLQLFMGTGWGLGGVNSFNGPIWSVSAEVLVYCLFWLSLGFLFRWRIFLPLVASALFMAAGRWSPIAQCAAYFFLGCAVYVAHRILSQWVQFVIAGAGAAIFFVLLHLGLQGVAVLFLFAGVTLLCAALEAGRASVWARRVPWLADNTYGTYLWHIPVQLTLIMLLARLGLDRAVVASSPWFLLLFLAIVTLLARISFLLFERPARAALRKHFAKPRRAAAAPAGR